MASGHEGADILDAPLVLRDLQPGDTAARMLGALQPNIIRPHVRSHLRVLALRVEEPVAARHGLAAIARDMKSAAQHNAELEAYRERREPGTAYVGIGLSAAGYERLAIPSSDWPEEDAFRQTMRSRELNDPAVERWEAGYRDGIDAIVVVGSHSDELTDRKLGEVREILGEGMRVVAEETGHTLVNDRGEGIEHFGYIDGRSQPLFIEEDLEHERATTDGVDVWNPLVALGEVLVPDPGMPGSDHCFGSFLVYRKLEQDVRAFKQQEERIAQDLRLEGEDAERAGALLVGRFEDGTPVTLSSTDGMRDPVPNNFTYAGDEDGARCPHAAHIRLMNMRAADWDARIVIARRGQSYGVRSDNPNGGDLADKPTGGVGLLFMASVASIAGQFERLQLAANGADGGPFDAVSGQRPKRDLPAEIALPDEWDEARPSPQTLAVRPSVTLLGGEYLFLPSISFLRGLDGATRR